MATMSNVNIAGFFYNRLEAMYKDIRNAKDIRELKEYFSDCAVEFDEYSKFWFVYKKIEYVSDPIEYQDSPIALGSLFKQLSDVFGAILQTLDEIED